jgi:hypothetical protein
MFDIQLLDKINYILPFKRFKRFNNGFFMEEGPPIRALCNGNLG